MMELYTIYMGWDHATPTLCALPVLKETAKTYILSGRDAAAGYAKVVPKASCPFALTPGGAWSTYETKLTNEIETLQARLTQLQRFLGEAQKAQS